jgi:hypothetical protein
MGRNRSAQPNWHGRSWASGPSAKTGELGSYDGWVTTLTDSRRSGAGRGAIVGPVSGETIWGSGEGRGSTEMAIDSDAGRQWGTNNSRPEGDGGC